MSPEAQIPALAILGRDPGFSLLCERFKKDLDALRDECMTCEDDVKANKLRAAWQKMSAFDPEKQRTVLFSIAKREAAKANGPQPMEQRPQ